MLIAVAIYLMIGLIIAIAMVWTNWPQYWYSSGKLRHRAAQIAAVLMVTFGWPWFLYLAYNAERWY